MPTRTIHRRDQNVLRRGAPGQLTNERAYFTVLNQYVNAIAKMIDQLVLTQLPSLSMETEAEIGARQDQSVIDRIRASLNTISVRIDQQFAAIGDQVRTVGGRISDTGRGALERTMKRLTGQTVIGEAQGIREMMGSFVANNVRLIQSIKARMLDRVDNIVSNGLLNGRRATRIAADVRRATATSKKTARLIARDQTASLNGQLDRARQTANGITRFVWVTVGDDRVREEHEELDGRTFTWANGAPGGIFPGGPINCRCSSSPVV